jgi:hypothetical protein
VRTAGPTDQEYTRSQQIAFDMLNRSRCARSCVPRKTVPLRPSEDEYGTLKGMFPQSKSPMQADDDDQAIGSVFV